MVRFSCFNGQINSHKSKKEAQSSVETAVEFQGFSHGQGKEGIIDPNTSFSKVHGDNGVYNNPEHLPLVVSLERGWNSEEMQSQFHINGDKVVCQTGIKKCQSLESGLQYQGKIFIDRDETDDEIDQEFSFDQSNGHNRSVVQYTNMSPVFSTPIEEQKTPTCESPEASDFFNNESIFRIGDNSEREKENSDNQLSGEHAGDSDHTPRTPPTLDRTRSLPDMNEHSPTFGECSNRHSALQSRSFGDLHVLDVRQEKSSIDENKTTQMPGQEINYSVCRTGSATVVNQVESSHDSYVYTGAMEELGMPLMNDAPLEVLQEEPSVERLELPSKDFKFKRIEQWVSSLEPCSPLEEKEQWFHLNDPNDAEPIASNDLATTKADGKIAPGAEAAKRYISSLSPSATTAQLSNHGLAMIPFLSTFSSLKVLNLSGNAIGRITAGSLPRGLHMLNLSRNQISTIEGLRDLTRLRVLDLSYNRILKIGHGLAYCSSLKELYLAGNKISEVEGLHRLLKLSVLDLRYNKISTAKCLGQLAANYNSLQAINIEGNPAQRNVGDEQLKKHLQGLLPHLAYYNRQLIKAGTLKDTAERSVRLGISSHQYDRGSRGDHKSSMRKSSHGLGSKASTTSHSRRSQGTASSKHSKGKHVHFPPSGIKANHHPKFHWDFSEHLKQLRSDLSMRRSHSEGTLGAF